MKSNAWLAVAVAALAAGCASEGVHKPGGPAIGPGATSETFSLRTARFSDMPGWTSVDLSPGFAAFKRSCAVWRNQANGQSLNGGRYGGTNSQWLPACAAAASVSPGGERSFFENFFEPSLVTGPGDARLTAYFEPVIDVTHTPDAVHTAPLLKRPYDMVSVDLRAFADALDDSTLHGGPRALTGQLQGNNVRPYPKRADISVAPDQVIAYAHPADLYNLQVQGSGRIRFEDGTSARASYAAQNGYKWNSALGALSAQGALPQGGANWASLRNWMDANGDAAAKNALNADPSYIFFAQEPLTDPSLGPRGAAGINLTAMGTIAVDPSYHPYGALLFVDGTYDNAPFRHLLVAQDTGGAIKRGPLRGDVFFGSGPEAGAAAEKMNAPARFWTLLPKGAPTS